MLDSAYILRQMKSLVPGFLAFLGYYELISWFRFPFNFTVERVTNTYKISSPLFIGIEIDFIFYFFLVFYLSFMITGNDRTIHFLLTTLSILLIIFCRLIGLESLIFLIIGLSCFLSLIFYMRYRSYKLILPGLFISILITEFTALVSLISYYIFGIWLQPFFYAILKERLIIAPLELISISILLFVLFKKFYNILLNKTLLEPININECEYYPSKLYNRLMLLSSIILIVVLVVLTHIPTVNPEFKPISVDTIYYTDFFEESLKKGVIDSADSNEIYGRPIYLFFLYHLWIALSGKSILLMDVIHPIVSLIILAFSSFYVTQKLYGEHYAGYSALFVPLGYLLTAFVAGGFQSNSIALSLALFAISINHISIKGLIKLSIILTLIALIHPWTYIMYTMALIVYNIRNKTMFIYKIFAAIISYFTSNLIDFYLLSQHVLVNAIQRATGNLGLYFFNGLYEAVRFWVWNSLSNPLYLSFSLLDTCSWTSALMALIFPLTFISPGFLVYRLILNVPLQLGASKNVSKFPLKFQLLIFLILLTRVLSNLSGLTPLEG